MNYQQHLALALVALGDDDRQGTLDRLEAALAEAGRIDPEGPRVAEVLTYVAQVRQQWGETALAEEALERQARIRARFSELS